MNTPCFTALALVMAFTSESQELSETVKCSFENNIIKFPSKRNFKSGGWFLIVLSGSHESLHLQNIVGLF